MNYQRWSFAPFILGIAGESFNPADGIANYSFSYQADSLSNMYYPSCIMFIPYNLFHHNGVMTDIESSDLPFRLALTHNQADLKDDIAFIKGSFPKQRFCNFVASADSILRRDFVKQLHEYKQVDCAGSVLNNTDELQRKSPRGESDWAKGKLRYIAQYRFTVAFENKSQPFYITEKILHPLMVGSIPIYWGAPNIAQFFNPASFINCHDYASFDAVIERIKEIDSSPELYQQYLNAPKVLPDSLLYDYTGDKIKAKMNDIMQKVVAHKQMRKQWHWTDSFRLRLQHPIIALKFHIRSARNDFLERYPRMRRFLEKNYSRLKI
ncbi:MAG: glycosyltransferase family 10 domain-containing protein [Candidatus Oxydemutatoraceae bacterium WSBS_2016_MAG_OTU14]